VVPVLAQFAAGFGLLSPIVTRIERELTLWLWRRERARRGSPVTLTRRRVSGRGYAFESRRGHADST
jgi:hypothetical protein